MATALEIETSIQPANKFDVPQLLIGIFCVLLSYAILQISALHPTHHLFWFATALSLGFAAICCALQNYITSKPAAFHACVTLCGWLVATVMCGSLLL